MKGSVLVFFFLFFTIRTTLFLLKKLYKMEYFSKFNQHVFSSLNYAFFVQNLKEMVRAIFKKIYKTIDFFPKPEYFLI